MRFNDLCSRLLFPFVALTAVACAPAESDSTVTSGDALTPTAEPITVENFTSHPAILEIMAMSKTVNDKLRDGALQQTGDGDACGDGGYDYRRRLVEGAGVTRRYEVSTGNLRPVSGLTRVDYDATGTIRYVTQRADVEGGELRQAAFFDASGKKIFEVMRSVRDDVDDESTATASPFTIPEPGKELDVEAVRNPAAALAVPAACPQQ